MSMLPQTPSEWIRFRWGLAGVLNFLTFAAHCILDGTVALLCPSRFANGYHVVFTRGHEVLLSSNRYWFNYIHGIVFIVLHLVCSIVLWRMRRNTFVAAK
jgi:hypothetical protein